MTTGMMTIKIGNGIERDISYYGMELISSPEAFGGEIKDSNIVKIDFPEEDGDTVYIPPNVTMKSFDYKIRLAFIAQTGQTPSEKIIDFMTAILGKEITIKNKYKGVSLVGYAKKYSDVEYFRDQKAAIFDLTIYVPSGKVDPL